MAKYITVICKVKGQTILKLIDDFDSVDNNVFYYKDSDHQTSHQIDLSLVKQEEEEKEEEEGKEGEADPFDEFNDNSCDSQESEDYFDESKTFSHFWNNVNSGAAEDNQSMDSYKKYLSVMKTTGRQMFHCKSPDCEYQTLWKNAIVNHIRSNHLFFFPFICGFPDCGKKFAIRSNLNNHRKVHSKRSALIEGVVSLEESSQSSSAGIDHNYSQSVVKRKNVFTQKTKHNSSLVDDNKTSVPQNINKNIKNKSFGKLKSKRRNLSNVKDINELSNDAQNGSTNVRPSSGQKPAFIGIKSVAQYIKQTERSGKIWRQCIYPSVPVCTYGTKYATSMVYHIRNNHLNDKPYVCTFCGKRFAMRTNLNNHKKVHRTI